MKIGRLNTKARNTWGKLDILVIALLAVVILVAMIYVLFRIIGHSEEHVEKIRKTKVRYDDTFQWRPKSSESEEVIRSDLLANPGRTEADYSNLDLNEDCMKLIAKMTRLKKLTLTACRVKDEWLAHISGLPLETLNLSSTPLSDKGLPYVLKLKQLSSLGVDETNITDKGLELISASKTIRYLNLTLDTRITDDGIKHVGRMKQLVNLNLASEEHMTGGCLPYLKGLENLDALSIEFMPVTADNLRVLSSLPKLRVLNASRTRLSDACLSEIARSQSLRILNLTGSDVSSEGILELAKMKHLSSLVMRDCTRVDDKVFAKLRALLPHCHITWSGVTPLSEQLSNSAAKDELEMIKLETRKEMDRKKATQK